MNPARSNLTKQPEQKAMRTFVVTTTINGQAKSQVWDASMPLPIGFPFRWVAESTGAGVRIRDVSSPVGEVRSDGVRNFTLDMIERGETIELPRGGDQSIGDVRFGIRPLRLLRPASDQVEAVHGGQLQVYACVGYWLTNSQALGKTYTGHAQKRLLFRITRETTDYRVDFLDEGIEYFGKDENIVTGAIGHTERFTAEQLAVTTLIHGAHSWRFAQVAVPTFSDVARPQTADEEMKWFRKSLIGAGVALILLMSAAQLWPEPKDEELIPAQFTQLVMKSQAPSASSAPAETTTSSHTAAPKKAEQAAVVQAFRAKALQSAVSGLLKGGMTSLLAQSDFVGGHSGQVKMFDSKNKALHSTGDIGGMNGKPNVQVAALGGAGTAGGKGGVGYTKGEGASVTGQGKTQISMDTSGSAVTEGLTKDEVGEVIHRHLSEVRYCYESAMLRTPDIEGKLLVAFTIGGAGSVSVADVKQSTLPDPRLDDCILRRLGSWKFPKPRGGVDVAVTYPFIFKTLGR